MIIAVVASPFAQTSAPRLTSQTSGLEVWLARLVHSIGLSYCRSSTITQPAPLNRFERHVRECQKRHVLPRDTSDARPRSVTRETTYEAECLAQPKGQLSSWPSVYALDLTDTWPNSFSIQLQASLMSQFIVHADAAHVLLEEDDAIPAN